MWGSSIEGEEKERGFISGNSFPLILRKAFSPSVVFFFLYFFVFLGDYKGVLPLRKEKAKKVKTHRKRKNIFLSTGNPKFFTRCNYFQALKSLAGLTEHYIKIILKHTIKKPGGIPPPRLQRTVSN